MTERRCEACEALITELDCLDCLIMLQSIKFAIDAQELRKTRKPAKLNSHCRNGHVMDEANTRVEVRNDPLKQAVSRKCRKCANARAVAQRLRNKVSSVF